MAGFCSSSDRAAGVRSGKAIGTAVTSAQIGRADSGGHAGRHTSGRGWTPKSLRDGGGPLPEARPPAGAPPGQLPATGDRRR
jgi:hypothetical protein